jgi:hypothetical protein
MFIPDLADPARLSQILDPWSKRLRITDPDPHQIFFFLFLTRQNRFQSSRKKDLGCSSRIPDPDFFSPPPPSWIPDTDPGVNRRLILDPGSGSGSLGRAGRFLPSWQGIPRDGTAVAGPGLSQSSYNPAIYFSIVPVQAGTLTMYTGNCYILVGGKTQKIRPEYRALHTTEALHSVLTWLGIGD